MENEKRNIAIDYKIAENWYNSDDQLLKMLALETFPELA